MTSYARARDEFTHARVALDSVTGAYLKATGEAYWKASEEYWRASDAFVKASNAFMEARDAFMKEDLHVLARASALTAGTRVVFKFFVTKRTKQCYAGTIVSTSCDTFDLLFDDKDTRTVSAENEEAVRHLLIAVDAAARHARGEADWEAHAPDFIC
jgi:hypothetical protein